MPRYRHIIWDWNGTLLDDVAHSVRVMNELLALHQLPLLDRPRYLEIFDFPVRTYYERAGFDLSAEGTFEHLGRAWMQSYEDRRFACTLQPGARKILAAVDSAGLTQSILSAYPRLRLEEVVGHFGLVRHFVRILGLDDIYAHSKLALARRWHAELGIPAREIALVGDTLHDFDVAEALGVDGFLVARGHQSATRLRKHCARVFESLDDLHAALGITASPPRG